MGYCQKFPYYTFVYKPALKYVLNLGLPYVFKNSVDLKYPNLCNRFYNLGKFTKKYGKISSFYKILMSSEPWKRGHK